MEFRPCLFYSQSSLVNYDYSVRDMHSDRTNVSYLVAPPALSHPAPLRLDPYVRLH